MDTSSPVIALLVTHEELKILDVYSELARK